MRFVLTADWHLREDRPRCRKDDDWIGTQKKALKGILDICLRKRCDLFVVGDMFHRPGEFRMVKLVQDLASELGSNDLSLNYLCGNHDMLYHSSLNLDKSAIGLLEESNNCFFIKDNARCEDVRISAPDFDKDVDKDASIVFMHVLCFPSMKDMPPNVNAVCAKDLLEEYPNAEWIFTGDYHKNFHYKWKERHVVNSGCLLRQASDFKDYQCGVYYIDTDKEIVEFIRIIDDEELVDDSYIMEEKERDERIGKFVDKLSNTRGITLDFIDNVEKALMSSNVDESVKNMVKELIGA